MTEIFLTIETVAPRGSVSAETQQQILTKAGMGMQAALARNS